MKNNRLWIFRVVIVILILLILYLMARLFGLLVWESAEPITEKAINAKLAREKEGYEKFHFDLNDPGQSPEELRRLVRLGYQIMIHTHEILPHNVGDRLTCTNCHFAGGNTIGGQDGGISLAGAATQYPRYETRFKGVIDLPRRINNCFTRSMNGKEIAVDSEEMLALVTYLHWISKGLPLYEPVPWLGLKMIRNDHIPDPVHGKEVYANKCAICHGSDGEGVLYSEQGAIPPLWGPKSFNSEAGMNRQETLEAFVLANMPYQEPKMRPEDARDVAAFIRAQPRP